MPPFRDDPVRKNQSFSAMHWKSLRLSCCRRLRRRLACRSRRSGRGRAPCRPFCTRSVNGSLAAERGVQLDLRRAQMLLGVVLVVEGADLDQPAAVRVNRRGRDGGFEPGGLGVGDLGAVRLERCLFDASTATWAGSCDDIGGGDRSGAVLTGAAGAAWRAGVASSEIHRRRQPMRPRSAAARVPAAGACGCRARCAARPRAAAPGARRAPASASAPATPSAPALSGKGWFAPEAAGSDRRQPAAWALTLAVDDGSEREANGRRRQLASTSAAIW